MHSMHYQRWNPPQSPVRIEFPPQLLAHVARQAGSETRGSLYGLLMGGEIRVLAARPENGSGLRGRTKDGGLAGLERIGIFVRRARGEVFLTESDLECFEGQRAAVALVLAGNRAGFFVRQADGSIQAVRSHEEFTVGPMESLSARDDHVANNAAPAAAVVDAAVVTSSAGAHFRAAGAGDRAPRRWRGAATLFVAIPLAALAYFRPLASPPIQLQLRHSGEAVAISWNPRATARGGQLEVLDGSNRSAKFDVPPGQSSVSYAPRGNILQVRMTVETALGQPLQESAFLAVEPVSPSPRRSVAPIEPLEAEVSELRQSLESGRERISDLQARIAKLTGR